MFPTERSAGVTTEKDTWERSSTRRLHTPASITFWMRSFCPSERYDNAHAASVRTSSSLEYTMWARVGSAGDTHSKSGWGLPRQKLERVQVALRSIEIFWFS